MAASSPDLRFADTNLTNPYLTIQNTSGKVGIGTASPLAQLTVVYDNAAGGGDARGFRLESATGPTSDVLFGGRPPPGIIPIGNLIRREVERGCVVFC